MNNLPTRRLVSLMMMFIAISAVIFVSDRQGWLDPVRDGLGEVLAPISARFEDVLQQRTGGTELEQAYATAVAQRNELAAENAQLTSELEEVEALRLQNEAERQRPDITYVPARVIGRDPAGQAQIITINKGSEDGLREGMAVVDPYMYVGQITAVDESQSQVLLITDPNASVGAMLNDARADGVVYGARGNVLMMRHVDKDVKPGEQEWVVTSDMANSETALVPSNIPIGIVIGEPVLNAQSDQLEITVQPGADFSNLSEIWIAVPND